MNARSRKTTVKAAAESLNDATTDKPLAADDTLDTATPNDESAMPEGDRIRILKKATCPKLSSRASGTLSYEIGVDADATGQESKLPDHTWLRITANQSSGYFSQEWIKLTDIQTLIDQQSVPFKAILFKPLYERKGANNHGFLGAALKAEGLVIADEQQPLVLQPTQDQQPFWEQVKTSIEEGIDLTDEVAQENARKEARKQARLAEQQRRRDANAQKITESSDDTVDATHTTESASPKTTPDHPKNPSLSTDEG